MGKYLLRRLLHGAVSIVVVVGIVMVMIYSLLDRDQVFAADPMYSKVGGNQKTVYCYGRWEEYGYLDFVPYADYLAELAKNGEIDGETQGRSEERRVGTECL